MEVQEIVEWEKCLAALRIDQARHPWPKSVSGS